jgi:signal transduction histidine kinase
MTFLQRVAVIQIWHLSVEGILVATILVMAAFLVRSRRRVRRHEDALASAQTLIATAEDVARTKAAQWKSIIASMPDGISVVDSDLRLVEWNEHMPEFAGVPSEILRVGLDQEDILRAQATAGEFGPVAVEQEVQRRLERLRTGVSAGTAERKRPNGKTMEYRRNRLAGGGFVTLYTDITDRRRAEDQLRQAQKTEAIGQLTGGVAHDFNNLLAVIMGSIDLAQAALQASNFLGALQKMDDARGGAQRAAMLTQRLVAFARWQNLDPKPTDANKIVSGMSVLLRHSIGGISLETVLAGDLWQTNIDPNQLESALLNLAINARDAMPIGGKVTIETANAYLDEAYAGAHQDVSPGQYVLVAVSDAGTGMSEADVERAFEPFFTTKEVGKGSGLGLSQVFGFIKQSNGHVKIYSELGSGTTVKLYLPRCVTGPTIEAETEVAPPEAPRARHDETVLVVEDDADVLAYTMQALESLGYRVIATRDAQAALAALDTNPAITLLFTDIQLPGLNGPELVGAAHERHPDLPVLYTTSSPINAIVHRGELTSKAKTIHKPFALAELAAAVRGAVDNLPR